VCASGFLLPRLCEDLLFWPFPSSLNGSLTPTVQGMQLTEKLKEIATSPAISWRGCNFFQFLGMQILSTTVHPLRHSYVQLLVCEKLAQRCAGPGATEAPQLMLFGRAFRKRDSSILPCITREHGAT